MNPVLEKYFEGLKPFFAFRSPVSVGQKIIHKGAKKPNYVVFRSYVEAPGGSLLVTVYNPRAQKELTFDITTDWYIWEAFESNTPVVSGDTDLINLFIEGINTLMLENGVSDPRKITADIGDLFLDIIKGSGRKGDVFDRTKD